MKAPSSSRLAWGIVLLSIAILGGVLLLTTEQTRERIREQMAGRDGQVLHAVALTQQPDPSEILGPLDDPANQLVVVLQTSRLTGVMGARLFDASGVFVEAFPDYVRKGQLDEAALAELEALRPVSRFRPAVASGELFLPEMQDLVPDGGTLPILEVNVPLHAKGDRQLLGIGQFLVQGHALAQEFRRLDQNLLLQGAAAFAVGGAILAIAILWSFRRLDRARAMLAERTDNLISANRELAMAAKTSAVGAVTAHLLHGLKNPLAGLHTFVASLGTQTSEQPAADLEQAMASTRRMQAMINEVVEVLREEDGAGQYEITLDELADLVASRVRAVAVREHVDLVREVEVAATLPNRVANLVALILTNLVQNGVEATTAGGRVRIVFRRDGATLIAEVHDQGAGFPAGRSVFAPCQSEKEGGSGIGLAICKQLAHHLGAGLELKENTPQGCVFALTLATAVGWEHPPAVTVTSG